MLYQRPVSPVLRLPGICESIGHRNKRNEKTFVREGREKREKNIFHCCPANYERHELAATTCDRMSHGRGIRAYMDVFTACHRWWLPIHVSDRFDAG